MSITTIENLSNEYFYEIFEYLDGCEIYQAFSNVNDRFQQLINSSLLLLKFNFPCLKYNLKYKNIYKELFVHHKHQILSFYLLSSEFFFPFSIGSSFDHLQSLVIDRIPATVLISVLSNLCCFPRLVSLTINTQHTLCDLSEVYRLIFSLPKLKYIECSSEICTTCDLLPMNSDEQFSCIEHLNINHSCTFNEFCPLISYTPHLRRLSFSGLIDNDVNIEAIKSFTLSNLTHLSIAVDRIPFDKLERVFKKFDVKLKVLSLDGMSEDINYVDANRWEEFIVNNFIHLEKFYFSCNAYFGNYEETLMYLGERDQFNSAFWLERQWILETRIQFDTLQYSICPYIKRWYEYDAQHQLSKSTRLIMEDVSPEKYFKTLSIHQYINHILTVTKIYHLEIPKKICYNKLSEILDLFPELDTLRVHSVSFSILYYLSDQQMDDRVGQLAKTQITKVYLETMTKMEELHLLVLLFPRINHFQINSIDYIQTELITRIILTYIDTKPNHLLRSLCFSVPAASDDMIQKLEQMIIRENLLKNFLIKRIADKICIQWK